MIWLLLLNLNVVDTGCPTDDCVQYVIEGESVPFSGQLLSPRRAALLGVRAQSTEERVALAIREHSEICEIKIDAYNNMRLNDQESCDLRIDLMENQDIPVLKHPAVVSLITVVVTWVAYFAALAAIKASN